MTLALYAPGYSWGSHGWCLFYEDAQHPAQPLI